MAVIPAGEWADGDQGGCQVADSPKTDGDDGARRTDLAVRVTVPSELAELTGAVLMDLLGPFAVEDAAPQAGSPVSSPASPRGAGSGLQDGSSAAATLVFYPGSVGSVQLPSSPADVLALLPPAVARSGQVKVEFRDVARDWVEGWRDHFRPIVVGGVRIRPPWAPAPQGGGSLSSGGPGPAGPGPRTRPPVDVVINPGLGFGTGLHPTTRGTLQLLQLARPHSPSSRRKVSAPLRHVGARTVRDRPGPESRRVVDAGTGSGILAVAAAKLGWGPVIAFDNDPVALVSARENVEANRVGAVVTVRECDVGDALPEWFQGATVLANMTLEPVLALVRKVGPAMSARAAAGPAAGGRQTPGLPDPSRPLRLVVSGILAGEQEYELVRVAGQNGFSPGQRLYEAEWVSMELLPVSGGP